MLVTKRKVSDIISFLLLVVQAYVQRAMQIAFAAGLSSDEMIAAMSRSEGERQCLHALWAAVMQLYHETLAR